MLSYSICFMLLTAGLSVIFGTLPGYITFEWSSFCYLLRNVWKLPGKPGNTGYTDMNAPSSAILRASACLKTILPVSP